LWGQNPCRRHPPGPLGKPLRPPIPEAEIRKYLAGWGPACSTCSARVRSYPQASMQKWTLKNPRMARHLAPSTNTRPGAWPPTSHEDPPFFKALPCPCRNQTNPANEPPTKFFPRPALSQFSCRSLVLDRLSSSYVPPGGPSPESDMPPCQAPPTYFHPDPTAREHWPVSDTETSLKKIPPRVDRGGRVKRLHLGSPRAGTASRSKLEKNGLSAAKNKPPSSRENSVGVSKKGSARFACYKRRSHNAGFRRPRLTPSFPLPHPSVPGSPRPVPKGTRYGLGSWVRRENRRLECWTNASFTRFDLANGRAVPANGDGLPLSRTKIAFACPLVSPTRKLGPARPPVPTYRAPRTRLP